jgi:hypothetical protein
VFVRRSIIRLSLHCRWSVDDSGECCECQGTLFYNQTSVTLVNTGKEPMDIASLQLSAMTQTPAR